MNRNFWLFLLAICVVAGAESKGVSILAGATQFGTVDDGTYWNIGQPAKFEMTSPSLGIRWDSDRLPFNTSVAVQYTYHGNAKIDALAVNVDAPHAGGYIPGGGCVGTCAPLSRWFMKTRTQSVAFTASKHFGAFSIEAGLNLYQTNTSGSVQHIEDPSAWWWHYETHNYMGLGEMFGGAYQSGNFSLRWQVWFMDTPQRSAGLHRELPPSVSNGKPAVSLMAGWRF
jgi:hypothetical protein